MPDLLDPERFEADLLELTPDLLDPDRTELRESEDCDPDLLEPEFAERLEPKGLPEELERAELKTADELPERLEELFDRLEEFDPFEDVGLFDEFPPEWEEAEIELEETPLLEAETELDDADLLLFEEAEGRLDEPPLRLLPESELPEEFAEEFPELAFEEFRELLLDEALLAREDPPEDPLLPFDPRELAELRFDVLDLFDENELLEAAELLDP